MRQKSIAGCYQNNVAWLYVDDGVIEVKAYADTLMATHTHHADPHPQYAPKASPVFTGTPTAPTAETSDNSTLLATTAFVQARVEALALPAASLKKPGIVQLSNATDSDSETMAATPKAVKAAMDLAASSSVKSVNGKKGEVHLTSGDVGALAQTGGTVNGPLTVEGRVNATAPDYLVKSGIIHDKANNVRNTQGLRLQGEGAQGSDIYFWEQIGKSAAMKFHIWSGGRDGGFDFHNTGEFHASGGAQFGGNIHVSWGGRTATFHENGDVAGPIWGGTLSAWLNNQLQNRTRTQVSGGRGGWWYKDESSGFIIQGVTVSRIEDSTRVNFLVGYQRECFGVQLTQTVPHFLGRSSQNILARLIENSGFTAYMLDGEREALWWAAGV